ncbi:S-adenosyl-L-methionine-dependent methyltransferase [Gymnopilus junonius]|uniref:S-adenosyl-L-methionine-dependent methyltransferase n=1 Tax=Gymnopilus junonius TaxID=109634 RepID=A0A9P5TSS0_GYMJU|nr:S-adenosyl-L-methionine-dependent methyltransferase [Gymnopilus junonius]
MDIDSDTESDVFSVASTPPASVTGSVASSMTSYEVDRSMRSASPVSVVSVTESMQAHIYRQEYGRNLNNYSDVYRLPADEEELDRLDKQHSMFVEVMGGKYVPPMASVMADDVPGEIKACLDLGCGSGSWIMDVARDFPNCSAVAVDLIPMQSPIMPPNLRSEVDDVNLGLEHFYGDFNVVHARLISSGIKDYHRLIDQIAHVLRPGGLVDVSEFDFHIYDKDHRRIEMGTHELRPPWWARWMTFMQAAIKNIGGDVDAATYLYDWVSSNPLFEDVEYREFWLPVVAPPRSARTEQMEPFYKKMKDDVMTFLRSGRPLLLGSGLPEDVINELEVNAVQEVNRRQTPQFTRLQCVYARKKIR